ncbi:MAG: serine/threonine protein kinase, partial [Planctomycetes bacterium]|nr:serine/threonine protein kinase [Planctomycetota bacterium]
MAAPDDPTQETSTTESMQRLERAIAAYLDFQSTEPPQDRETWLAAHPDLRDLLEPMLDGDPEPVAEDPVAGRQLGDFELVRRIGTGGMGVVYEAEQCSLGRRVALKLLRAHLSLESRALARFRREATIIASLEHPGIVKVLAVGEHEGAHFFAMELVDGVPLNKVITQISGHDPSTLSGSSVGETVLRESLRAQARPDPQPDVEQLERVWSKGYVETVVSLMAQVAQALGHAHDQGVVHRDVKPSNILVRRDGRAVLTDFGVARVDDLPGMTLTGEFAGSPHYVAPEQAMAKRVAVDHRADIFSLGATLYELLTLRLAFPGETNQEVLARIVTKDPVDPQKLNPKLAPDLAAIVMKALEKDPDRRYANARAFAEDLESFLSYRPVQARRVSMRTRVLRTVRREPLKAALIAVLLLAVPAIVGMGGYLLAKSRSIEVGDQTRREEETERRLATAYHQLHEGLPSRAVAQFAAILADDPSVVEARVGQILALLRSPSGQQRARELIGTRSNALPGIEQLLVRRARGGARPDPHTSDLELPAARTSAEYFLQAMVYIELGELGVDAWFVKAYEMLSRALLLSHRVPRY